MVSICSSRLFNLRVNMKAMIATTDAKSKLILYPHIPENDAIIPPIKVPPINCPALESIFTIACPAPLSVGFASLKTIYLKGAPMIVTSPTPTKRPAAMNSIMSVGCTAMTI